MQVRDFMRQDVVTTKSNTSLPQLWKLLSRKHIHSISVVDGASKLLGIIVKEDFLKKLFPDYSEVLPELGLHADDEELDIEWEKLKHLTAASVMKTQVLFTRPDTNVMRALSRMIVQRVRQLPVLDDNDQLIGVISKGDIFDRLFMRRKNKQRI